MTVLRVLACVLALSVPQALLAQAAPTAPAAPAAPAVQPATPAAPPAAPAAPQTPAAPGTPLIDGTRTADSLIVEGLDVQTGGLTVEDTVRRALAVSSTAGEKQAEIDAANARITQTIWQFVPKLGVKASYMRLSDVDPPGLGGGAIVGASTPGPLSVNAAGDVIDSAGRQVGAASFQFPVVLDNFNVTASLAIPLSDYLLRWSDANDGAEASREAAQFALEAAESKVRTDARVLYYNWLRAHAQLSLAKKAVERTRARLEDARAAESVGKLSRADLMRIEALSAQADLAVVQVEALRTMIAAQLAIIMRDKGGGQYTIGSALPDTAPQGAVGHQQGQALIAEALANRIELKAIDRSLDALDDGASATNAGSYPRLDAIGELQYANPNQRYFPVTDEWNASWTVGIVASFNFDAPFMAGAQADEIRATASGIRSQRRGLEALVVNEVVTSQLDVVKASAALQAGEISVRAAEEAYRVATDLFRVGRGTTSDLIDAETDLINAKASVVNARIDLTIATLRLHYALGREPKNTRT
jgi:outer membrane protein